MAKKYYVYSTLANDQLYTLYESGKSDLPIKKGSVLVKGGAGVADKRLFTPLGVVTEVTEEQVELLKTNPVFVQHQKNGFVVVKANKASEEAVAADMQSRDESAPTVDADFEEKEQPKTNNKKK